MTEVDQPGRAAGQRHHGVQLVLGQDGVDPLRPVGAPAGRERLLVLRIGERPLGLGLQEDLLAEVGHHAVAMALVEVDRLLERVDGRLGAELGEVAVEVRLEIVEQDLVLACRRTCPRKAA